MIGSIWDRRATKATIANSIRPRIFHLVDRREDHRGGVMMACVDWLDTDPPGQVIAPEVPCPIVLAAHPYPCLEEDSTSEDPAGVVPGQWATFAFPLLNKSSETLDGSSAYMEHLGGADAEFAPGSWQLGLDGGPQYASRNVAYSGRLTSSITPPMRRREQQDRPRPLGH
jgi:hypothetical protein